MRKTHKRKQTEKNRKTLNKKQNKHKTKHKKQKEAKTSTYIKNTKQKGRAPRQKSPQVPN